MTDAPTSMLAAVFTGPGHPEILERPAPTVSRPDDVLIEVEACGICGTDLHILDDPPGHPATPGVVLGHEFVGIVRSTGSAVRDVTPGQRVAVAANLYCHSCTWCKRGLLNHCEHFTTLGVFEDGGLADRAVAPARACFPVDAFLPLHEAVLVEPLSCVMNGVHQARLLPGQSCLVIGAGPIGLLFLATLRAAGAGLLVAVDPLRTRRDRAAEFGADVCLDPAADDVAEGVREATGGLGVDVAVDAVGSQFETALTGARTGGRVVLFGMDRNASAQVSQFELTRRELTVVGAYVGMHTFPSAIQVLDRRVLDLGRLVSHAVTLAELPAAMDALRAGEATKVIARLRE